MFFAILGMKELKQISRSRAGMVIGLIQYGIYYIFIYVPH